MDEPIRENSDSERPPPVGEVKEEAPRQPEGQGLVEDSGARTMAMLAHLLGAVVGFLGPLIIWLIKKDENEFIDDQAKEALNFQILILIATVISGALIFACIGAILLPIVFVVNIVFCILGAVAANRGERYRYPFNWRLIT